MTMQYDPMFIVRFRGTLTQGPNKGKSYDFADSWGGAHSDTESGAREQLAGYQAMEPTLEYQLFSRQYVQSGRKGKFVETEIAI